MHASWRDARGPHVVTRGNVDGILSAAGFLASYPRAKVSFVPSSGTAADAIRKDLSSDLVVADLGLTPPLARAMNDKGDTGQSVLFVDHHQQSLRGRDALGDHVTPVVEQGPSATSVVLDHLDVGRLAHLGAVADHIERCRSRYLSITRTRYGDARIQAEARCLDYAWRMKVEDDRFRRRAARALAVGAWPSGVDEVHRRYRIVRNEGRFERACERARRSIRVRRGVAILDGDRRLPSLLGFGMRAVTAAAEEAGAALALRVNRRDDSTGVSLRSIEHEINLGRFAEDFTAEHGIAGGGHPTSAGARIHTRDVPKLVDGLVELASA